MVQLMRSSKLVTVIGHNFFIGEKYNIIAICDGGPDWSVSGTINLLSIGDQWMEEKLDMIVQKCTLLVILGSIQ